MIAWPHVGPPFCPVTCLPSGVVDVKGRWWLHINKSYKHTTTVFTHNMLIFTNSHALHVFRLRSCAPHPPRGVAQLPSAASAAVSGEPLACIKARIGGLVVGGAPYHFIEMIDEQMQCHAADGHGVDPCTIYVGAGRVAYCLYCGKLKPYTLVQTGTGRDLVNGPERPHPRQGWRPTAGATVDISPAL